ncbi:MAG TPA: bifunctional UDP-N-acetylmuramoyl-tripeptide:D-alanyl-D-alanine ligase/alanine racemase, partial [Candidatus Coprenecus stercoripullorum]|nr:bifunctional UDP-N-acetylmuramoyl-tripeptide:D-alanyl-D-alanine ligase/alanine racemase [Candidatus Coprenecus stercoripullorum]
MKISVDSRTVLIPSETEFYALKGKNHDGHDYIEGLYSKGVRHFVASEHRPQFDKMEGASVFYCDDTLKELQDRAARYRQECRAVVAGITGSNGKTVVKEWIAQLLGGDIALGRSP